jgi:death-on-curing protein
MIRYLSLEEVLELHRRALQQTGGLDGVRDLGGLESAIVQPRMTFGGQDLYPCLPTKAAALGFSLVCNHPFLDGNKRVGHLAMEIFLEQTRDSVLRHGAPVGRELLNFFVRRTSAFRR